LKPRKKSLAVNWYVIATKMKHEKLSAETELPKGVTVTYTNKMMAVKGPKGEVKKLFANPKVTIELKGNKVIISGTKVTRKEKAVIYAYHAHLKNMILGVQTPYVYEMIICATHFPMTVTFTNGELTVKNFLGEKFPRKLKIDKLVSVKVSDKNVVLEGCDKEMVGMTASNIEQLTRIADKDLRVFQDGIYITKKEGKEI
jgi:large subunit ribosomal protein L6